MNELFLPWTTRGVKYDTREYLVSLPDFEDVQAPTLSPDFSSPKQEENSNVLTAETSFLEAVSYLKLRRGMHGPGIEYGCFNLNGSLIEDESLRFQRQMRNILFYSINEFYCLGREKPDLFSYVPPGYREPVSDKPQGNWAIIFSDECPNRKEIERALNPLIKRRAGKVLTIEKMDPEVFVQWLDPQIREGYFPQYLLICDSFENIPLEIQFLFNAFAVAGRLWFNNPNDFETYANKVLQVEKREQETGSKYVMASPADDTITFQDTEQIIKPIMGLSEKFTPLLSSNFNEKSLLKQAKESRFLALYCHGVGISSDDSSGKEEKAGSFVLKYDSDKDEGLLVADEVTSNPFVPGGIFFSPACLGGGTVQNSDYASWLQQESLKEYLGSNTKISSIGEAMLRAGKGPIAALLHFDISMGAGAPMFNPITTQNDLQKMVHENMIRKLLAGKTLGKATNVFRWAAGSFYGQAIRTFMQTAGSLSADKDFLDKSIGEIVRRMNRYHVIATDMRNFVILGDPAVRLMN